MDDIWDYLEQCDLANEFVPVKELNKTLDSHGVLERDGLEPEPTYGELYLWLGY